MSGDPAGEGPWRVSPRLAIVGAGGAAERADLVAALAAAGLRTGAVDAGTDLLLLDPRTQVSAETVLALRHVVDSDPMIVAAMPRLLPPEARDGPEGVRPPAVSYAVVPDPRCLYVKRAVLAGLGAAGVPADPGEALAGLNRFGFRIALAGHALARHPAGAFRPSLAEAPAPLRDALAREAASAPAAADRLIEALRPGRDGRLAIAFDLSALGASHSGTTRLAAALVRGAAAWPDLAVSVVATEAAFAAHIGGLGPAVARVDPSDPRVFAAAIRIGQPFLWGEIEAFAARAPVLVAVLLDTIGLDCLAGAPDELDALWRFVCAEMDGLLFNSAFTERQFARRFALRPDMPRRVSLHSLDLADYREGRGSDTGAGVLLVGNRLPHKRLRETAEAVVRAGLGVPVSALGLAPGEVPGVTGTPSGGLAPEALARLYAAARVVVYPSVYEGFGFPILEALAHRRPILVRDLPPYREIAAGLPEAANIHTFRDDADLVARLENPPVWQDAAPGPAARGWDAAVADLRQMLDAAIAGADRDRIIRRIDLLRGRMSYMRGRSLAHGGGDALDRLAGATGRLARSAVLGAGRRVPPFLLAGVAKTLRRR